MVLDMERISTGFLSGGEFFRLGLLPIVATLDLKGSGSGLGQIRTWLVAGVDSFG